MAELPFFSSPRSQYEPHIILPDQENIIASSSPIRSATHTGVSTQSDKPRKPPTVTPKRFTKFFTPRASKSSISGRRSRAGRQLRDITKNAGNRQGESKLGLDLNHVESGDGISTRPWKRRRYSLEIPSSPPQSSPLKHVQSVRQIEIYEDQPNSPLLSDNEASIENLDFESHLPQPLRRLRQQGRTQRIVQRGFGGYDAVTAGWRGYDHCTHWEPQTANFVTTPTDIHTFSPTALPFCVASCNTNSLIAVGEEAGSIRIIDSLHSSDFTQAHIEFQPHSNAIMDMTFSSDDFLLATASGDQTARIIDMHTQRTICILSGHKSSVKQVRFHPHDDNVLTTSSRDGSVMVWDMRYGGQGAVQTLRTQCARNTDTGRVEPSVRFAKHILDVGSTFRSHTPLIPGRHSETAGVSITSIQRLSHGRDHLLLTTSEVNASIKVWDLRNAVRRGGLTTPLSNVLPPSAHQRTRNYGINAMLLSNDGSRVYASCRDSIVYAYSTDHLVLGCASETSSSWTKARIPKTPRIGVGPLYGFRHPAFRSASFYVKATIRPIGIDQTEMIAVGSSDGSPVLFPTDERYLPPRQRTTDGDDDTDLPSSTPPPSPAHTQAGIPIYEQGTALIGAHNKEVTSLTFTHGGELATVSDDFTVRCWREDAAKARELRTSKEGGAQWGCGWADASQGWDDDDG